MGEHGKKLFYIYPFNTLVEQNMKTLSELFKDKKLQDQIVVVNSLTPITVKENIKNEELTSLTETLGGNVEIAGPYPGWEYKADSRLREVMVEAYKHLYNGEEPVVEGIHAGLECGIFASKLPGLDAVSFGPQMEHIHTTNEVLSISSTERTWELVVKTLAALK